jgi:Chalcone isomerase-like
MVKVYVAGPYLQNESSDASAIIKVDEPKRLVMQFLHDASKKQMTDAFAQSFKDNAPDAEKTMKTDIDGFLGALEDVKVGEQMIFTYVPATGTTLLINGKDVNNRRCALWPSGLLGLVRPEASHR